MRNFCSSLFQKANRQQKGKNYMREVLEAIKILRENGFTNRSILVNVNNEDFSYEESVNEAFLLLKEKYITFKDEDFDKLVNILYNNDTNNQ